MWGSSGAYVLQHHRELVKMPTDIWEEQLILSVGLFQS